MNGNRESLKFFKKIVKKMILLKNGVFRGYLKLETAEISRLVGALKLKSSFSSVKVGDEKIT